MKSQQKLERLRQERAAYLESSYRQLGKRIDAKVMSRPAGVNYVAGFISALFGCTLMLVVFTAFDLGPVMGLFYSAWHQALNNLSDMLSSNITG
jgi:hypothetical protein